MSTVTVRWLDRLADVDATVWDGLHDGTHPFISHAFLHGLEHEGCLHRAHGWQPHHPTLWRDGELIAAAPGYIKTNSHGEFVFDHAWAHAYEAHGHRYFPKLLIAVPYSPVPGPRLLARDAASRAALVWAIEEEMRRGKFSSAHVNFHAAAEDGVFDDARWLSRLDVQYHWQNDSEHGHWRDYDDFLAAMDHKHRKNLKQERAKVQRAGVTFRIVHGADASEDDLDAMHGFYLRTFADYGNFPALTRSFFGHVARAMPENLVLFLAQREGRSIAGACCLRGGETLYGRYWGADESLPGLHFETCYHQGIDYCLHHGLTRFSPGAQGEHKIARGFLPTLTRSRHLIADAAFSDALESWCAAEREATLRYCDTALQHGPFRRAQANT